MTDVAIYVLTHTPTNTAYVGSSIRPYERIGEHIKGSGAKSTREWISSLPTSLPSFRVRDWCAEGDRSLVEEVWILHYALVLKYRIVNRRWKPWPLNIESARLGGLLGGRKGGLKGGRKGGLTSARTHERLGWVHQREAGRKSAGKNNRRMLADGTHPFLRFEVQSKGGKIGWKKGIAKMLADGTHPILQFDLQSKGGRRRALWTNHIRWHVNRGIVSSTCELCEESE